MELQDVLREERFVEILDELELTDEVFEPILPERDEEDEKVD